jgi:hypothetical protein
MFISKQQKETIELLNNTLGTKYRSKSFDFNNPEDIIEAATYVTAEYCDMNHYWASLEEIAGEFDQSIEVFNPSAWMSMSLRGSTNDKDIDTALKRLTATANAFRKLMDKSEEKCVYMWKVVLINAPVSVREHFFGEDIQPNMELIEKALDENIGFLTEFAYNGVVEHSAQQFATELKRYLENEGD